MMYKVTSLQHKLWTHIKCTSAQEHEHLTSKLTFNKSLYHMAQCTNEDIVHQSFLNKLPSYIYNEQSLVPK